MSVDAVQLADHGDGKFHQDPDLGLLLLFVLVEETQPVITELSWRRAPLRARRPRPLYLVVLLTGSPAKPGGGHVRAADRFDLLHAAELGFGQQLRDRQRHFTAGRVEDRRLPTETPLDSVFLPSQVQIRGSFVLNITTTEPVVLKDKRILQR